MKQFFCYSRLSILKAMLKLAKKSHYLNSTGWTISSCVKRPVSMAGEPMPWITYPCIDYLEHIFKEMNLRRVNLLEYGAGWSTLWWAHRCGKVYSIEHDEKWYNYISAIAPDNVTMRYVSLLPRADYAQYPLNFGVNFEILVIDGRNRALCAKFAPSVLTPNGVIIFDNADREKYLGAINYLKGVGFRYIPFYGLAPVNSRKSATFIFYREGNIFNL